MAQKIIRVQIDPSTGDMTCELDGYQGKGCEAVMKQFVGGNTVKKSIDKPEMKQINLNTVCK